MARLYLDTNVFISYVQREIGFGWRALFVETERFFIAVKKHDHVIILSPLFFREVEKITYMKEEDVMAQLGGLNVKIEILKEITTLHISPYLAFGVPTQDATHIAYAVTSRCDVVVTFNLKDFQPAQKYIKTLSPAMLD